MLDAHGELTAREAVVELSPLLLDLAEFERDENAEHYDGAHFGAAILGLTRAGRFDVFTGHNYQPIKRRHDEDNERPKICAEQGALLEGDTRGLKELLAVAIVGILMRDDQTKLGTFASHMCRFCRPNFDQHDAVSGDSIFISKNPELQLVEVWRVGEVIDLHEQIRRKKIKLSDVKFANIRGHVASSELVSRLVMQRLVEDDNPLFPEAGTRHRLGFRLRQALPREEQT